ncbi:MAG: KH domain-containing protein [Clostridia bacterium]|nr:KH domain-containing protein [Clostridia bacterium]
MENNVLELIKYVVETFAEKKEEVEYAVEEKENVIEVTVLLNSGDMGKVIGKQGKIAKALRTLVSSSTPRGSKRYSVEIKEKV